jgi:hypothetical protein
MKIRRYTAGRTNVERLADQQSKIVPPGQIAAAEAAPFMAFADMLESAGDTVLAIKEAENKAIDADDANRFDLAAAKTENRLKINAAQAKAENWSPEKLLSANQETIRKFASLAGDISDRNRDKYAELIGINAENWAEMTRLESNVLRAQNTYNSANTTLEMLQGMGRWDDALTHIAKNRDAGVYGADEATKLALDVSQKQQTAGIENAASEILDNYMDAYRSGSGDAFLEALINDEKLPSEVKELAVKMVKNQQENFEAVDRKKAAVMKTRALAEMTQLEVAIKAGQPLPFSIDSWAMKYLGATDELDAQIMQWRKQMYLSTIKSVEVDEGYQQFKSLRTNPVVGGYIKNNVTNRKYLSREIAEATPDDATPEQAKDIHVMKVREAQFLDEGWETMFATAVRMLNPTLNNTIATELDEDTQRILTNVAKKIQGDIDPFQAAQEELEQDKLWRSDDQGMRARSEAYGSRNLNGKSVGVTEAQGAFKELLDNSFDAHPWINFNPQVFPQTYWSAIDPGQAGFTTENEQQEAFAYYEKFYFDEKMRGATPEQAAANANRQFTARFKLNNINGDWGIQKDGVDGDYNQVRLDWIDENADEVVLYGDGGLQERPISELDDITFQRPFEVAGEKIYEVWNEDGPLMRDVERTLPDGRKTVRREIVIKRIGGAQLAEADIAKIREETDKRIKKYMEDYETATTMLEAGNPYAKEKSINVVNEAEFKIAAERRRQRRAEEDARRRRGLVNDAD